MPNTRHDNQGRLSPVTGVDELAEAKVDIKQDRIAVMDFNNTSFVWAVEHLLLP
jgi:hypothetical protein